MNAIYANFDLTDLSISSSNIGPSSNGMVCANGWGAGCGGNGR